jgi:hypothetical protein
MTMGDRIPAETAGTVNLRLRVISLPLPHFLPIQAILDGEGPLSRPLWQKMRFAGLGHRVTLEGGGTPSALSGRAKVLLAGGNRPVGD